ncbi:zinc-binding dehydrogenase [Aquibacillus kalidii]|uniref:zinc-binding dehydrogenase n=1 Tax=Aquibacillus kalidii TaxID=2762597 RepID=UPI0016480839|nr:zinc-binding dehydrogenase [Aquibacillus kalidii]
MKAFVHRGNEVVYTDINEPVVKEGQVIVALKVAGLNHRDLNIPNRRGNNSEPLILGSDGAGVIEQVGEGVKAFKVGDEVIINPGLGWKENSDAPPEGFEIVGLPDHGTFAEKFIISEDYIEHKPAHLNWEEAGVLALAALTGYRALFTKGVIKPGETIFIPGAGSGVATFIIQFAKAVGARVIVSSRDPQKREKAIDIGADLAIDTNSDWKEILKNEQIDLVIDSVGKATFNRALAILKRGGRMVTFGATTEDELSINIRQFFYGQYQLLGSTMGSKEELQSMLQFIEKHNIKPIVDKIYPLSATGDAFDYLRDGNQFGKIGLLI